MLVQCVAGQVAGVRLIVADAQIAFIPQARQQWQRQPCVARIKDRYMPWPRLAPAQLWCEAVQSHNDWIITACDHIGHCAMVRAVKPGQAPLNLCIRSTAIAGNNCAVVDLHQQRGVILASVRINHQPGKIGGHNRCAQRRTHRLCHAQCANIIGDVPLHIGAGQAKVAPRHVVRHKVAGMVTRHHPSPGAFRSEHLNCICHRNVIHICLRQR